VNSISLEWRRPNRGEAPQVGISIDGQELLTLIREIEAPLAEDGQIIGAYAGLDARVLDLRRHFLGDPDPTFQDGAWTEVLVCADCQEPGCWPLRVKIEIEGDTIAWTAFQQPHRPGWSYEALGSFRFDRLEYEAALGRLVTAAEST